MESPAATMTRADFARHLGVDRSYVTRLGHAGRLVLDGTGRAARVRVADTIAMIRQTAGGRDDMARLWRLRSRENSGVAFCLGMVMHEVMVASRRATDVDAAAAKEKCRRLIDEETARLKRQKWHRIKQSPEWRAMRADQFAQAWKEKRDWVVRNRIRIKKSQGLDILIPAARQMFELREASRKLRRSIDHETLGDVHGKPARHGASRNAG